MIGVPANRPIGLPQKSKKIALNLFIFLT